MYSGVGSRSGVSYLPIQVTSCRRTITSFRPLALTCGDPEQLEVSLAPNQREPLGSTHGMPQACTPTTALSPATGQLWVQVFKLSDQIGSTWRLLVQEALVCLVWCRLQYPASPLILAARGVEQNLAVSRRGGWFPPRSHSDHPQEAQKLGQEAGECF